MAKFAESYKKMGCHVSEDNTFICTQWAPGAQEMWLQGDFNGWNKYSHPFKKLDFGKWRIEIPADPADGSCAVKHNSIIKLVVKSPNGEILSRYTILSFIKDKGS